jgi:hypothetical protein
MRDIEQAYAEMRYIDLPWTRERLNRQTPRA